MATGRYTETTIQIWVSTEFSLVPKKALSQTLLPARERLQVIVAAVAGQPEVLLSTASSPVALACRRDIAKI
jgi:hypothetical protein